MTVLRNEEIFVAQRRLGNISERIDVCTYSIGPRATELVVWGRQSRVLCGVFSLEDIRKIQAWATRLGMFRWNWKGEVRYLGGLHAKLFIGHFARGKGQAILSSSNLGTQDNIEFGYHITRAAEYKSLAREFETYWACATPVKPLDAQGVVESLSTSVFEDQRESTVPDQPTNRNRRHTA